MKKPWSRDLSRAESLMKSTGIPFKRLSLETNASKSHGAICVASYETLKPKVTMTLFIFEDGKTFEHRELPLLAEAFGPETHLQQNGPTILAIQKPKLSSDADPLIDRMMAAFAGEE